MTTIGFLAGAGPYPALALEVLAAEGIADGTRRDRGELKGALRREGTATDDRGDRRLDRSSRRLRVGRRAAGVRQEDEGAAVRADARVRGRDGGPQDQAALELLRRRARPTLLRRHPPD